MTFVVLLLFLLYEDNKTPLKKKMETLKNAIPKWQDLTTEQAQKQWEMLQDDLCSDYGGEFVDYLLERIGTTNLMKQVAFLECVKIIRDYHYDRLEANVEDDGTLNVFYIDGGDSFGVRL